MSLLMIVFYCLTFLAVYVQVFLLVTFFERRKDIMIRKVPLDLSSHPSVTVIVPCYNEESTVSKTIDSLLELNYPKEMLKIIVVDDGSKDNTWSIISEYKDNSQVSLYKKENGGKHTALNLALEHVTTEFVGCLDADSEVDPETLKRIMTYFDNPKTMAVAPSIIIRNPKNIIQYAQRAEYDMAHYTKKMLAFMGGIHVTPGPFSIFRKRVFDELGPYRKAHHTEDQEIALRMQKNGYKIDHCPDAYVYTGSPDTISKLFRQRVRWIYGFIKNATDYKEFFFKPKYGAIGLFTLPSGFISISGTIFLLFFTGINIYQYIVSKVLQIQAVGFNFSHTKIFSVDFFFINTQMFIFITVILYILVIAALINGRRMITHRRILSLDIILFIVVYSIIAPIWLLKSVWNALSKHEASWTAERDRSIIPKNI